MRRTRQGRRRPQRRANVAMINSSPMRPPRSERAYRFILRARDTGSLDVVSSAVVNSLPVHNPTASSEWSSMSGLFDLYKVLRFTLAFKPSTNINPIVAAASIPASTYGPLYMIYDPDSVGPPASVAATLNYRTLKVFNFFRPFTYTVHRPQITTIGTSATTAAVVFDQRNGVLLDIASASSYNRGVVSWYCDNMDVGSGMGVNMGDLILEWDIVFFGRR